MKRIGVFCSSHSGLRQEYVDAAEMLGSEIGRRGADMVYGGSACGLMDVVARAVRASGGRTIGVVPRIISERRLEADCDLTFYCENLDDRKATMVREADIFVALPGGVGTLDEVFTVAAASFIGYHRKRVVLYNVCGFWNPLLDMLRHMEGEHMLASRLRDIITVAGTCEELIQMLFGE